MNNFKGISTLIGILIIVVWAIVVGGILVWQLGWFEEEVKMPEVEIPEGVKVCKTKYTTWNI